MSTRPGDWMQTFTGKRFWPLDPRPEDICIEDIAHALSLQCRYGGHCLRFYSVAEHCVLMAEWIEKRFTPLDALAALLHDAAEAYVIDIPRPLKRSLPDYRAIEDAVLGVIFRALAFSVSIPDAVKDADNRIISDERVQNLADAIWDFPPPPPLGVTLQLWSPQEAEARFVEAYKRLWRMV